MNTNKQICEPAGNAPNAILTFDSLPKGLRELLGNQAVLPSQYWASNAQAQSPECCLMLAVLWDAIRCYQRYDGGRRGRQVFKEAQEWIENGDKRGLFSFDNICEVLGVVPQCVRQALLRWRCEALERRSVNAAPLRTIKRRDCI
ncbi:hypothetical protein A3E96_02855 [Candidatus Uhrbacteria bacterium RIFCSPHIGHO2_12_FULL_46_13]|nr:MAG: hypothetical protein UX68_C0024G0013 [Parcubacteria group bacterium GW2011_GWA2_46_9]OGL74888.1 MAG: hypothetical protein A3E96_02855 [Candidatus Uhrbacteria bacterium RIFCSPHIGHO2_12_FULL_46_13]